MDMREGTCVDDDEVKAALGVFSEIMTKVLRDSEP